MKIGEQGIQKMGAAPKYLDPKYLGIVKTLPNPT